MYKKLLEAFELQFFDKKNNCTIFTDREERYMFTYFERTGKWEISPIN